ncbi:pancreatic secretory granule membrane major glycoprotein GP2-like [Lissotriton helveticus]
MEHKVALAHIGSLNPLGGPSKKLLPPTMQPPVRGRGSKMKILAGLLAVLAQQIVWHTVDCQGIKACANDEVEVDMVCRCNDSFYRDATENDLVPVLTCDDFLTISVSKCLLEALSRSPNNSYLSNLDMNCTMTSSMLNNIRVYSFAIPTQNGICGNVMEINGDQKTFSNILHIPSQTNGLLNVPFSCTYTSGAQNGTALVDYPPTPPGNRIDLAINDTGSILTIMTAYSDSSYARPIDKDNYEVAAGSTLYFGIISDFLDSETFVLRAENCFAGPTSNSASSEKVLLISGGCADENPVPTTVDSNGESLEVRFSVDMFIFQSATTLHLFCDVQLCLRAGAGSCTACTSQRRADELGPGSGTLRIGPISVTDYDRLTSGSCSGKKHNTLLCLSFPCLMVEERAH